MFSCTGAGLGSDLIAAGALATVTCGALTFTADNGFIDAAFVRAKGMVGLSVATIGFATVGALAVAFASCAGCTVESLGGICRTTCRSYRMSTLLKRGYCCRHSAMCSWKRL